MKKKELYYLWSIFAGRCAFENCRVKLIFEMKNKEIVTIGELCHVIAQKSGGPRGDPLLSTSMAEDPDNIILLCRNHHRIIDENPDIYTIIKLKQIRAKHIEWVNNQLTNELKEEVVTSLILYDTDFGIVDESVIKNQFLSDFIIKEVFQFVSNGIPKTEKEWARRKRELEAWWKNIYTNPEVQPNFSIFAIQYIPIMVLLGFLIRDTMPIKLFQHHRISNSWKWKEAASHPTKFLSNVSENLVFQDQEEIAISVSLSAKIDRLDITNILGEEVKIIEIYIENPSRLWLSSENQIIEFKEYFLEIIDKFIVNQRQINKIHLFCAVPTPIAFIIGSMINPNMFPPVQTYKFIRREDPSYKRAISFNNLDSNK